MSVTGISSLGSTLPSSTPPAAPITKKEYFAERNADVAQLNKDVQAGDLSAAQQDYANIVALGKQDIGKNNPYYHADRAMDFNAIGGALENGDLSGAKTALAALYSTYEHPAGALEGNASSTASPAATAAGGVDVAGLIFAGQTRCPQRKTSRCGAGLAWFLRCAVRVTTSSSLSEQPTVHRRYPVRCKRHKKYHSHCRQGSNRRDHSSSLDGSSVSRPQRSPNNRSHC